MRKYTLLLIISLSISACGSYKVNERDNIIWKESFLNWFFNSLENEENYYYKTTISWFSKDVSELETYENFSFNLDYLKAKCQRSPSINLRDFTEKISKKDIDTLKIQADKILNLSNLDITNTKINFVKSLRNGKYEKKNRTNFISSPLFTTNKEYCLIFTESKYSFQEQTQGSVRVYKKIDNKNWKPIGNFIVSSIH